MTTPLLPTDPATIGPYTVTSRIDSGGQGTVYLARAADGTQAAVKVLGGTWEGDSRQRDRFVQELTAARRVAPFCTAAVLDADMDVEPPYIASEYVPGPTLRSAIENDGPRTGPDLDRLAIATVTALAAVHEAGVVHRDLKPGNVILGPDGPRVIDFGIARLVDATRQTTTVAGTPAYMSPEQIRGRALGPASDLFSWAAVMVYAATGHRAFHGGTTLAIVDQVLTSPPDLTDVPERLHPVLERCLDKDPDRRPTAMEVLAALIGGGALPEAAPATLLLEQTSTAVGTDTARIHAVPEVPAPRRGAARGAAAVPLPHSGPDTGALSAVDPVVNPTVNAAADPAAGTTGTGGRAAAEATGGPGTAEGPWRTGPTAPGEAIPRTRVSPRIAPRTAAAPPAGPPAGPPGGAPPAPAVDGRPRRRRRSSAGWVTAGALVVLAALGGVLFWAYGLNSPPPVEPVGNTPTEEAVDTPAEVEEAPAEEEGTGGETDTWTPPAEGTGGTDTWGGTEVDCHADPHHPDCVTVDPPDCETHPDACWEPETGTGGGETGEGGEGTGGGTGGGTEGGGTDTGGGTETEVP
ncbi:MULTISPECIES: serine/threonine-protein kinase [unclassified Nocardiopsis]|uniref:serine/threonine-protein kinase n=1 Tax=Nocardiopsis TaxID=2013 RepID=UPI00387B6F9C